MPMVRRHILVSTHSRLKAAGLAFGLFGKRWNVSTHSRLKAAGFKEGGQMGFRVGFNTQPPDGGWMPLLRYGCRHRGFNTQPPEGGWDGFDGYVSWSPKFQHTAARRRLAD